MYEKVNRIVEFPISKDALVFLIWFRLRYRLTAKRTYKEVLKGYPFAKHPAARKLLQETIDAKYITVRWDGYPSHQTFCLNPRKYNELFDPIVFQRYEQVSSTDEHSH